MSSQTIHHVTDWTAGENGFTWWTAVRLAIAIFLGLTAVRFLWMFADALAVLVLSITIADAFEPLVRWFERRMSRTKAVLLVYVGAAMLVALAAFLMIPAIVSEFKQLTAQLPDLLGKVQSYMDRWLSKIGVSQHVDLAQVAGLFSEKLVSLPMDLAIGLLTAVLVIFLSFYWLLGAPAIGRFFRSLFPESKRAEARHVTAAMSRAMGGYLRGVALNGLAIAGITWVALLIAGVNDALVLSVLTGAGEFFPYVGPILTAVPAILVALLQSPEKALITVIIYIGIHQIEGHLLTPNIMRSQTDIPRPLVIIALFAGGAVGGLLGAVVAIPTAGAAKVCIEQLIAPVIRRRWRPEPDAPDASA